jgi:hypothetical protein
VDHERGFKFDWCAIGGGWQGWRRHIRKLMRASRVRPLRRALPRILERNALWSEDLLRFRVASFALLPIAVITPHGEWGGVPWELGWGKASARERRFKVAWIRRLRTLMRAYPVCLAIAVAVHL